MFLSNIRTITELITILKKHRALIFEMARREISDRYSGQVFGMIWAVVHPAFLMAVYFFVFNVVFKIRLQDAADLPRDYTTYLLSGLVMWLTFMEVIAKSGTTISSNSALVKQVIFPIEILAVKTVCASLLSLAVSLAVLIIYSVIKYGTPPATYLLLPVVLIFHFMAMVGVAYFLSAIGVYFRDVKDFFQLFALVNIYIMPIFYLPGMVPGAFKYFVMLNPFSAFALVYQDMLFYGAIVHPWAWVAFVILSATFFVFGYGFFKKLKPMFGNAL